MKPFVRLCVYHIPKENCGSNAGTQAWGSETVHCIVAALRSSTRQ